MHGTLHNRYKMATFSDYLACKACNPKFRGITACSGASISTATARPTAHRRPAAIAAARRGPVDALNSADDCEALPPQARVFLEKKDMTLRELLTMVEEGDLNLQPQYQRGLVWDRKMASRLVVTALESRIIPTIYLEDTEDGYMMMDGKQRLTSLLSFIAGKNTIGGITWDNAPVQLDLNEDSCDPRWIGKSFHDLPEERQRKLNKFSILCVIVSRETDRDVVYGIYQDINTGAVGHTEQQNRKAAFHGSYIYLLDELAGNTDFLKIQGREAPDSEKEYDRELVLRFFAMLRSADQFKTPLMRFLNQELKAYQHADDAEIGRLREQFKTTAATVWQIFGPQACRLPKADSSSSSSSSPSSSSKAKKPPDLNPALWDATMVAVCKELERHKGRRKELIQAAGAIRAEYVELCRDSEFRGSLDNRSKKNVLQRVAMLRQRLETVAPVRSETRAYSQQQRLQLWQAAGPDAAVRICGICQQTIHMFDDCEVDHIVPFSLGGATNMNNAQLVHRFCNRNKGNRMASSSITSSGTAHSTSMNSANTSSSSSYCQQPSNKAMV